MRHMSSIDLPLRTIYANHVKSIFKLNEPKKLKRNISIGPTVLKWAEELARIRGFETFTGFVEQLIRDAWDKHQASLSTYRQGRLGIELNDRAIKTELSADMAAPPQQAPGSPTT